jgi:hypothetical protein
VFLEHLAAGWSVTAAAGEAGCDRRRFYEYRDADEAFAAAWEDAWQRGTDVLVDELHRRALGYDEETWDGDGNLLRRVRRYSDPSLIAALKARDPERFRDNAQVAVTVPTVFVLESAFAGQRAIEAETVEAEAVELPEGGAS